jgi:hypothetical protein
MPLSSAAILQDRVYYVDICDEGNAKTVWVAG